ncbi:hypothetical protein HO173_004033 [Letharia columbiana]|uniref:Uncharacterized protein n=1 Tax=Letharia columbiana TaxID=112416 RepID=A0A8H6L6Z3_9LECA|nr:uncharacterized protein HO173_004033 [Letharia columbiana]KAF6237832.1 hypothetical protein HO173_004033 [Letharia columbiana]
MVDWKQLQGGAAPRPEFCTYGYDNNRGRAASSKKLVIQQAQTVQRRDEADACGLWIAIYPFAYDTK